MNIVFDIGNVLINDDVNKLLNKLIPEDKEVQDLISKYVFGAKEWQALNAGEITQNEAKKKIKKDIGLNYEEYVDYVFENWYKNLIKNEYMVKLAKGLKKLDWNVFILSNAQSEVRYFLYEEFGKEFFDGIVISQEEKQMKPSREIFETLINRYKIKPEDSIFIDDSHKNVEVASEFGFSIIEYNGDNEKVKGIIQEKSNEEGYADLHIHPLDKLMNKNGVSIKEILKRAIENKTYLISLTSHNTLEQYRDLYDAIKEIEAEDKELYQEIKNKIKIITGLEINTKIPNLNVPRDFLVYGIPLDKMNDIQSWLNENTNKDITKEYQIQILEHLKQVADKLGIRYDANIQVDDNNKWGAMAFAEAVKQRVDFTLANILTKDNPLNKKLKDEGIALEKTSDYVNKLKDNQFLDNNPLFKTIRDIFYEIVDLKLILEKEARGRKYC